MFNYTAKTDEEILDLAKNGEYSATFNQYWIGNVRKGWSDLEMDQEFVKILAMYTRDPAQIDSLFRKSGRFRPDWDKGNSGSTYGQRVINGILLAMEDVPVCGAELKVEPELKSEPEAEKARLWDDDSGEPSPIVIRKGLDEKKGVKKSVRRTAARPKIAPAANKFFSDDPDEAEGPAHEISADHEAYDRYLKNAREFNPMSEEDWICKGFLRVGEVTVLWGKSGSGKTMFMEQLGLSLAHGIPFLGFEAARPMTVIMINEELSKKVADSYHQSVLNGLGVEDNWKFVRLDRVGFKLNSQAERDRIVREVIKPASERHDDFKVLIFDSLAKMGYPQIKSNQAEELMTWLIETAEKFKIHILMVNHPTKKGRDQVGAAGITNFASTVLRLNRRKPADLRITVDVQKQRCGLESFALQIAYEAGRLWRFDPVVKRKTPAKEPGVSALEAMTREIINFLQANKKATTKQLAALGNYRRALDKLRASGDVETIEGTYPLEFRLAVRAESDGASLYEKPVCTDFGTLYAQSRTN